MRFFNELRDILILVSIIFFLRSTVLNWYFIPSNSMLPTLNVGDHIVVNKLSYGLMLPFMDRQITFWSSPKRGELVVFQAPQSEGAQTQIKRVVGLPGDTISFQKGVLTINGQPTQETIETNSHVLSDFSYSHIPRDNNLILEAGLGQQPHFIFRKKEGGVTFYETQTWTVPNGKLFCLGDNRDDSYDSRFWGLVEQSRVYGKAFLILYSTGDKGNMWPHFRNDRWFRPI